MKVILRETLSNLGKAGEVKNVRDGYARNFLFPRGLAEPATAESTAALSRRIVETAARAEQARARYPILADKLSQTPLRFTLNVGAKGQAFGSITAQDIADAITQGGMPFEKKWLELPEPIKAPGEHTVKITFPHQIAGEVRIIIEAKT